MANFDMMIGKIFPMDFLRMFVRNFGGQFKMISLFILNEICVVKKRRLRQRIFAYCFSLEICPCYHQFSSIRSKLQKTAHTTLSCYINATWWNYWSSIPFYCLVVTFVEFFLRLAHTQLLICFCSYLFVYYFQQFIGKWKM